MKTLYFIGFFASCSFIFNAQAQEIICTPSFINSDWSCLGPFDDDSSNIARVTALFVEPTDNDYIYLGTRGSGLWKTSNGGLNWSNVFSYQLAGVGINKIVQADVYIDGPDYNGKALYCYSMFGSIYNRYCLGLVYFDPFTNSCRKENIFGSS